MDNKLNFELLNKNNGSENKDRQRMEKSKKTVLDIEASEGEVLWTCSLILVAYAGIGVILTGKLILDILSYFGGTI